ncbi:phosphopentomutase, partial [Francisella tularensis subsp. holarctica]|nr:phosphopentomutase [Francisella tularensis subsp. holarctica]
MLKDKKVVILLIDSFGIGQAPDAAYFVDEGADTLGHIVDYFTNNG